MVDYISTPPSSAYDRALQLAQDIAKNGGFPEDTYVCAILIDHLRSTVGPPGGEASHFACRGPFPGVW